MTAPRKFVCLKIPDNDKSDKWHVQPVSSVLRFTNWKWIVCDTKSTWLSLHTSACWKQL